MDEYLGVIKAFAFGFAPRGWALCDGSLLSISSNTALFALLGTTYGGNGQNTFALPDLRGRVAIGQGQGPGIQTNYQMGQVGGNETVLLLASQMPAHNHNVTAFKDSGDTGNPEGALWANTGGLDPEYRQSAGAAGTTIMGQAISTAGQSQAHPNLQPYLVINYCICLQGIFPSRN